MTFSPEARDGLLHLYNWLADADGSAIAITMNYAERIEAYCEGFRTVGERGHLRDDTRPGLRIVGFEKRVSIAFAADDKTAPVLRLF